MTYAIRHFLLTHGYFTVTVLVTLLLYVSYKCRRSIFLSAIPVLVAAFAIFTFNFGCQYSYPVVKHLIGHYVLHAQTESGGGDNAGGGSELPVCDYGPQNGEPWCESCIPGCSSSCQSADLGCCFMWLGPCVNIKN
jgi:hypothetical protein